MNYANTSSINRLMASKPLQWSKKKMEEDGYSCWITEKWQSFFGRKNGAKGPPGVRIDMFNLVDITCIREDVAGVTGVQSCSDNGGSVADHVAKARQIIYLPIWLSGGNRFLIQGWGKRRPRDASGALIKNKDGSPKREVWTCREVELWMGEDKVIHEKTTGL